MTWPSTVDICIASAFLLGYHKASEGVMGRWTGWTVELYYITLTLGTIEIFHLTQSLRSVIPHVYFALTLETMGSPGW